MVKQDDLVALLGFTVTDLQHETTKLFDRPETVNSPLQDKCE